MCACNRFARLPAGVHKAHTRAREVYIYTIYTRIYIKRCALIDIAYSVCGARLHYTCNPPRENANEFLRQIHNYARRGDAAAAEAYYYILYSRHQNMRNFLGAARIHEYRGGVYNIHIRRVYILDTSAEQNNTAAHTNSAHACRLC